MMRSTERILTTHAGRLPNPDNIAAILHARDDDPATLAPRRLMGQRQGFCLMGMQQRITPHGKAVCYQGSQLGT